MIKLCNSPVLLPQHPPWDWPVRREWESVCVCSCRGAWGRSRRHRRRRRRWPIPPGASSRGTPGSYARLRCIPARMWNGVVGLLVSLSINRLIEFQRNMHNKKSVSRTSLRHCLRMPPLDMFFSASSSEKLRDEAKTRTSAMLTKRCKNETATSTPMPWVGSKTSNSFCKNKKKITWIEEGNICRLEIFIHVFKNPFIDDKMQKVCLWYWSEFKCTMFVYTLDVCLEKSKDFEKRSKMGASKSEKVLKGYEEKSIMAWNQALKVFFLKSQVVQYVILVPLDQSCPLYVYNMVGEDASSIQG